MKYFFWRKIYNGLSYILLPFVIVKWWLKSFKQPLYRHKICTRLGIYNDKNLDTTDIWIHAVSLGESQVAMVVVKELLLQRPDLNILISSGTATGYAYIAKNLQPKVRQAWQPWDAPFCVQRFYKQFKPQIGILIETEVWPNLMIYAKYYSIPVFLVNARMSESSFNQLMPFHAFMFRIYQTFTKVWAQTSSDQKRLQTLGAPLTVTMETLKFSFTPQEEHLQLGKTWRKLLPYQIVLLASSRTGEEQMIQKELTRLKMAGLALWVVPRHPERFDDIVKLLQTSGEKVCRRSSWGHLQTPVLPLEIAQSSSLVVGDSLGEMTWYYSLASVVIMGGSFAPHGGQNFLEAMACSCPVILGPHTFNFLQVAEQAEENQAVVRVQTMSEAITEALKICQQAEYQKRLIGKGHEWLRQQRSQPQKLAEELLSYIPK